MKAAYNKNEEPIVISKALLDLLLSQEKPTDLIVLYVFYYYTAKWQGTNQVRATVVYVCGGLKWTAKRTQAARKKLAQLGLIEDLYDRNAATGRIEAAYVKVNFLWSKRAIEANLVEKSDQNVQGVDFPPSGESTYKCLRKPNKENASGGHESAGVPSGGPDEHFADQEGEGQAKPVPEAPLDDGSLAGYERRRSQAHRKHFFQQHFTEAQRLLSNGQLLERQPLTDEESASLAIDFYDYRCSVHHLNQEEPKEEAYFSDADQYQFKKLSEEEATARFSVLNAVIAYLRLDTKALQPTLPPEQADAHQRLRMLVWNGKQLRDNWTLALVAIRAFLAELPPLETPTTKG